MDCLPNLLMLTTNAIVAATKVMAPCKNALQRVLFGKHSKYFYHVPKHHGEFKG